MAFYVGADCRLEFSHASKDASPYAFVSEVAEKPLNHIEPGSACRREVNMDALMALEPRLHLCVFVCGIVVADNVDLLFFGHASLNQAKELQPLLVTMLVHTCADHGSRGDLQSGKQRGGSVALVIVCHCPATTLFQRQSRLGSVQCLDLTLLVATEDHSVFGRGEIEPHDVVEFLLKVFVVGKFEALDAMWLDAVACPDSPDRRVAYPGSLRH